jgi:hypothetical protein
VHVVVPIRVLLVRLEHLHVRPQRRTRKIIV